MPGKLQSFYDNFYYEFERWFIFVRKRWYSWRETRRADVGPEFARMYREEYVPYWARFGVKPSRAMTLVNYLESGKLDPRYISNDVWGMYIVPYFNDRRFSRLLADKNLNGLLLPRLKRPDTLFRCMSGRFCLDDFTPISRSEAVRLCAAPGHWVIKPTLNSYSGANIRFFDGGEDPDAAAALLDLYGRGDYIVQRAVVQHPVLSAMNSSSVNTLRLVTLVFREKAMILSSILRVGQPGSRVDNIGAGGYQFAVEPDGSLEPHPFSHQNGSGVHLDVSGQSVFSQPVPGYAAVRAAALEGAERMPPHLRLVAWDFAVDENSEPVLLEFNTFAPSQNQETCGPTFGDMSDEILSEVFAGRRKKS